MSIKKYSDEKLFDFIKQGDRKAYEELYDRYKRPLVGYVLRKLNKEDAHDLTHDLWVKIWEKRETLDVKGTVVSYLFKAARNGIIDHMSKSVHSQRYISSIEAIVPHNRESKADYQLREKMFMNQIEQVLNKYSDKAQSIVRLRMEGYNNSEIAEKLSVSEKTIRNLSSSILKFLKSKLPYIILIIFLFLIS